MPKNGLILCDPEGFMEEVMLELKLAVELRCGVMGFRERNQGNKIFFGGSMKTAEWV